MCNGHCAVPERFNECIACWLDYPSVHNGAGPYCPKWPNFKPVPRKPRNKKK